MAKKKAEQPEPAANEEMVDITVAADDEEIDRAQGLHVIPGVDIEVQEVEAGVEEVPAGEPEPSSAPDATVEALLKGFEGLQKALGERQATPAAAEVAPATPEESDEDFEKRVNEDLFKDNPAKVLKNATERGAKKVLRDEIAPLVGSLLESAFENAEFRLKNDKKDGPIFDRYEADIKALLKTLPAGQQKNPQVLKAVFQKVKADHIDEIIEQEVQARAKPSTATAEPARRRPIGEGAGSIAAPATKPTVRLPASELEAIKHRAAALGIDYRELVARRSSK